MELQEIKKALPHGAMKEISKRTGIRLYTISRALSGDKRSLKYPDVLKATAEYMAEHNAKENEAVQALNEVFHTDTAEREKFGDSKSPLL